MKNGDLVVLKSGGPVMTVKYVSTNGAAVKCHWFDKKTLHGGEFDSYELKVKKSNRRY